MNHDSSAIGVIFDMDGVLVESADAHLASWELLASQEGVKINRAQFAATFGRQNRDIVPLLFGPAAAARVQALAERKEKIYRDLIREHPPIVAGAVTLVEALHEAGVLLAVGSSGPKANIDLVLSAMGVTAWICVVVSGDDVARGKPDPQVFAMAAERLGLPPRRCVVVEDAPVGIQAARAAGAAAVAVLSCHTADAFDLADAACLPDLIVDRLADLSVARLIALVRE